LAIVQHRLEVAASLVGQPFVLVHRCFPDSHEWLRHFVVQPSLSKQRRCDPHDAVSSSEAAPDGGVDVSWRRLIAEYPVVILALRLRVSLLVGSQVRDAAVAEVDPDGIAGTAVL